MISVIVPVYNMEDKLERCLDSLVNQTYKNIEIIVINDGSKDNSINVINKYKKKYKNIVVIDRENKGISVTRNEGIKIAKGDYIAFVDSDDYVELDMYEKLYKKITKDKSDIVVCNYKMFNDNLEFTNLDISNKCNITNLYDNPKMVYNMDYAPWNKLFKKNLWDDIEYPVGIKYEDLEAVLKVFLKTNKVSYLNEYLYNYYININGETLVINDKIFDIFKILDNLESSFKGKTKELKNAYQELCVSKVFIYNNYILNTRDREFSKKYMKRGYEYLDNKFKHWRLKYILNYKNTKDLFFRVLQSLNLIYYKYINFRTK